MRIPVLITIALALLLIPAGVEGMKLNLSFCCAENNDLYQVVSQSGIHCPRYAAPAEAIEKAAPGSGVLILADGYPTAPTKLDSAFLERASEKKLRLYIEYPDAIPGIELGAPQHTQWERAVVSSDAFGKSLPNLSILAIHDCHFLPTEAKNPLLVVARVAGFDTAVYGLPEKSYPILFELPERNLMVATTKLSQFVTARYAPTEAWKIIWEQILAMLDPTSPMPSLTWEPVVRPAYGPKDKLPSDAEKHALSAMATWYHRSKLLLSEKRKAEVDKKLLAQQELDPTPQNEPDGDGTYGILEGYCATVQWDGSQLQRLPLRADCNAEAAMVLALDGMINGNSRSREAAKNLLDFIYFNSGMCKGGRGNPKHPAYGHVAWGDVHPLWLIANYGDDEARVLLATMATAACLESDRWNASLLRALLANLRVTGPQGFRSDRIDMAPLEQNGWKYYHDTPRVNYSTHHESYLMACNLWAYRQTGYKPFLENTKNAIRMLMEAYPSQWRLNDTTERARALLVLSWLVRVEDTPEHRGWLTRIAKDLLEMQDESGALRETINQTGGQGGYVVAQSNEAYGTTETPLIQKNGDPVSDQLYTTGYALLGLHEAVAATGDPELKKAEDKLSEFLCRIQVRAKRPELDGSWFRALDYKRWEYWASSGDIGWGAWSAETGWAQAWTAAVMGLRVKDTSLWEITTKVDIAKHFREVKEELDQTPEGPWQPGK